MMTPEHLRTGSIPPVPAKLTANTMTPEELAALTKPEVYRKEEVAWFMTCSDPRWELSNMAGGMALYWPLVRCRENQWNSSEQLYQATKYGSDIICLPQSAPDADPSVRRRIQAQPSPRGAKLTQKCAVKAGLVRSDWEDPIQEVRIRSMLWVLELKLYWNPMTCGRVLAETGSRPIVEISTKDPFWGCRVAEGGTLHGSNVLGKLLESVRSRSLEVRRGQFSSGEGFLLP